MHKFTIDILASSFSIERCVTCGQSFRWSAVGDSWHGIDGENWFAVSQAKNAVHVLSSAPECEFHRLFQLAIDLAAIEKQANELFSQFGVSVRQGQGLRVMVSSSPMEVLFSFVCSANNHLPRITKMVRILSELGNSIEIEGTPANKFPTVEVLAGLSEDFLRKLGFGYRAHSVPAAARYVSESGGAEWLHNLKTKPFLEAHLELCKIPFVGPKVADCIALYGLGFAEAVPIDVHLWNFLTRHIFREWDSMSLTAARYTSAGNWMRSQFGKSSGWVQLIMFEEERARRKRAGTSK